MVVIAFVVPLALTVRDQAEARALSRGQRTAQAVAGGLAVAASLAPDGAVEEPTAGLVVAAAGDGRTSVFLPGGEVVGAPAEATGAIAVAAEGRAFTTREPGGAAVLVPVTTAAGNLVVRVAVPDEELRSGVAGAWLGLAVLGVLLILAAVAVADRLARSLVRPVGDLAAAARRMAAGDLESRVEPEGPPEIAEVGTAFNLLAERLDDLLAAERESVADLSHRLRTPLTALRLQAEMLEDRETADSLLADVDRLGREVDAVIAEARRPSSAAGRRHADLAAVAAHRVAFWGVLAEEQGRTVESLIPGDPVVVPLAEEDLATAVDTLLDNVFTHTPAGTGYRVEVGTGPPTLVVDDAGPGFSDTGLVERGRSGAGGTGLGLDIVGRSAGRAGGGLSVGRSPLGGARVVVRFGPPA
jgi:signal transduction histidine kinase